jgi:hypothetical protein
MKKMVVGLLAAAGITLAVPAYAQGVWFGAAPRYEYAPGYDSYAYDPGPNYSGYGYAYAPRGGANYWGRSRSLNHGQGPGCIQSPASHEYTSCD